MSCAHPIYRTSGPLPFFGPVSRNENRAAHGGIRVVDTCKACGAIRQVLINGEHHENGEWVSPAEAAS